jgi:hypothetical protein
MTTPDALITAAIVGLGLLLAVALLSIPGRATAAAIMAIGDGGP